MRKAVLICTLGAVLLVAGPATAATGGGGVEAVQADAGDSGGARYATLSPTTEKKPVKKKASKKKRKGKKRRPKPKQTVSPPDPIPPPSDHVFPIQGPFSFGGKNSRFGAGRRGHVHQGQDMSAAEGTPVIAPWTSTVEAVKYQAGGAGYYVVLDGDGEDRDYVFMHLRKGSILVERGDAVAKGQQIAQVGNTGSSSGPHLHFEIWVDGGWYTGGYPIDPLRFLKAWLG